MKPCSPFSPCKYVICGWIFLNFVLIQLYHVLQVKDEYKGCVLHPPMEKRRRTEQYFMYAILYPDLRSNGLGLNVTDTITVSKFHLQAPNLDGGGTMNLKVQFVHRHKVGLIRSQLTIY
jgi:hypothetical protein